MSDFNGRLGIVQRVLPRYRVEFFDLLAGQCKSGLGVFAGAARPSESIPVAERLEKAKWTWANNLHLLGGPLYMCLQRGLMEWIEEWNPDCLIVEANPRYLSTQSAIQWMRDKKRTVIGWGLGAPNSGGSPFPGLRHKRRQRFLSQFNALIAYSQRGAEEYRKLGFPADRVFVAPNAVVRRPNNSPAQGANKKTSNLTLLYVGRLQNRKRLDSLIRACSLLPPDRQPNLQIIGDGPARADLKNLAASIYPRTEFTGGRFGEELDQFFDQADLFVLPGTGGLAIQQAMAHGLPVIAAEGDGSQEDMVRPENGWLIEPGSDKALETALSEALANPQRLQEMGKKSFELVQNKFNLENMVASFISAIHKVTG